MSLKENMDFVKEELNSEEKFLEGFVKLERFFKKYKLFILGGLALVITAFIAVQTTSYLKEENKIKANIAFDLILKDPTNKEALGILKELNTRLYEIALYKQAKTEGKNVDINVQYLKELSAYENALQAQNIDQLNKVSMQNDFLLKEFAIFNKALIQTEKGQFNDAKETLKLIPSESKAKELVALLNHYLLTK